MSRDCCRPGLALACWQARDPIWPGKQKHPYQLITASVVLSPGFNDSRLWHSGWVRHRCYSLSISIWHLTWLCQQTIQSYVCLDAVIQIVAHLQFLLRNATSMPLLCQRANAWATLGVFWSFPFSSVKADLRAQSLPNHAWSFMICSKGVAIRRLR